jgi:hypothetical protein
MAFKWWQRRDTHPDRAATPMTPVDEICASLGGARWERITQDGAPEPVGIRIVLTNGDSFVSWAVDTKSAVAKAGERAKAWVR